MAQSVLMFMMYCVSNCRFYSFIFETEDTVTQDICFLWLEASWVSLLCAFLCLVLLGHTVQFQARKHGFNYLVCYTVLATHHAHHAAMDGDLSTIRDEKTKLKREAKLQTHTFSYIFVYLKISSTNLDTCWLGVYFPCLAFPSMTNSSVSNVRNCLSKVGKTNTEFPVVGFFLTVSVLKFTFLDNLNEA